MQQEGRLVTIKIVFTIILSGKSKEITDLLGLNYLLEASHQR